MDSNAAEPVNPGGVAVADKPNIVNPGLETPVNNISPDPLSNLQGVVDAAKEAAAAQTPEGQFENQFGLGPTTPPVPESPSSTESSIAPLDPSIQTVDDLLTKGPQVVENPNYTVEAVASPEKTPADILRQKISDSIDAFLEKVT